MSRKYKYVTELFEKADFIDDPEERAVFMRANMRESVKKILASFHNPEIEFYYPKGLEFKSNRNKLGVSDTTLDLETKRLYMFQKSNVLEEKRKKAKLIQLLESIAPEESTLLYNSILTKKNPYKNLNKNFIKKYFPEILELKLDR